MNNTPVGDSLQDQGFALGEKLAHPTHLMSGRPFISLLIILRVRALLKKISYHDP